MTDRSPSELEREAEQVRAEISETTRQLRDKMSPGQLMDEALGYFKDGDAQRFLTNFKDQVRDNPLALALVGGGLAWLMAGSGVSSSRTSHRPSHTAATSLYTGENAGSGYPVADSGDAEGSSFTSSLSDGLSSASDAASHAAASVTGTASNAGQYARETMHDVRDQLHSGASSLHRSASDFGNRARDTFADALEREPLIIGALGLAVGAALGALIPATRTEERYLGSAARTAKEQAEGMLAEGVERAKEVAGDVYAAARDEADRQGLTGSGEPVSERLSKVAKAAGEELSQAAHGALGGGDKDLTQSSSTSPSDGIEGTSADDPLPGRI